jgi:N-acetylglutamate synthase-like GNAT family acetyltransferase
VRLEVRPYEPADADGVRDLVLAIQRGEFGMDITAEDQPDLVDVPAYYRRGFGNFWVAIEDGELIGTIGLLDIGNDHGTLRKMFVKAAFRGGERQVAARLLDVLVEWARSHGLEQIYLGTTEWFHAARRFYLRHGFVEIPQDALPAAFPVMKVDSRFFRLAL